MSTRANFWCNVVAAAALGASVAAYRAYSGRPSPASASAPVMSPRFATGPTVESLSDAMGGDPQDIEDGAR